MMDPTIVGLIVFAIIVLVVIWKFRHRVKIGIKGPAGLSLEVEAENAPPNQVPNATGINRPAIAAWWRAATSLSPKS